VGAPASRDEKPERHTSQVELQTEADQPERSSDSTSGKSSILQELRDDDWAAKLRAAIDRAGAADDVIRVLAARAASEGQLPQVLTIWSNALERSPRAAILIGQALPHLCDAAARTPEVHARIIELFGQSLQRARALDAQARDTPGAAVPRLTHALLATDMAVPSAHAAIIEIVRAHRSIIATDDTTWPFLAPLA
jgi:hypothetical protein